MKRDQLKFYAANNVFGGSIDIGIAQELPDGRFAVALPIAMETVEAATATQPAMSLSRGEAQSLMDELWRAGVRPADANYGSLSLVQNHLNDMKKIAFHKLGIKD